MRANQVQKETIIIIIINWPVAHLISLFTVCLHYCALHNLSLAKAGLKESVREREEEREQTWKLFLPLSLSSLWTVSAYAIFASIKWNWNFGQVPPFYSLLSPFLPHFEKKVCPISCYLIFLLNALIIGQIATPKACLATATEHKVGAPWPPHAPGTTCALSKIELQGTLVPRPGREGVSRTSA